MSYHDAAQPGDIHLIHQWRFADQTDRLSGVSLDSGTLVLVAADRGKIGLQEDASTWWVLVNHSPITWKEITAGGGGGGSGDKLESLPGEFTVPAPVSVGDLVYSSGVLTLDAAGNASVTTSPAIGIVIAKPLATTATVAFAGKIGGLVGMTAGALQFLGTSGSLIEAGSLPTAAGSVIQQVGVALTSTMLLLDLQIPVVL